MIIYGELLFIENMIVGGVLLYITGEICGRNNAKLRLLAGSAMCGVFSLVIFFEDQLPSHAKAPLMLLMEMAFAVTVCVVVFGCKARSASAENARRFQPIHTLRLPYRHAITFIFVTYFMGGMIMGLLLVTQQQGIYTAAGIYTGDMKAGVLAIFVGLTLATSKQIIKTVRKHKIINQHMYRARLVIREVSIETEAFVDTGNHLKDPIGGKPVAIASGRLWDEMQRAGMPILERFTMVPYVAVGSRGILDAVRLDYMEIMPENFTVEKKQESTRCINGCVIAKSDGSFRLGDMQGVENNCQLLISAEIVGL